MAEGASPAAGAKGEPGSQNAFKLIRNQPVEESSSAGLMMIVAGLLVVVALGAALMMRRPAADAGQGDGKTAPPGPATPPVKLPEFVLGQIEFLEEQGQLKGALEKAESYKVEYPNSPELDAKIKTLRQHLGLEEGPAASPRATAQQLMVARQLAGEGRFDQALEALDKALESDPESAEAMFARGDILAAQGNKLDATGAYEAARSFGFDPAQVDAALQRLR